MATICCRAQGLILWDLDTGCCGRRYLLSNWVSDITKPVSKFKAVQLWVVTECMWAT